MVHGHKVWEKKVLQAFEHMQQLDKFDHLSSIRPLQMQIIMAHLTQRKDLIVHLETGGGKTLIYQLIAKVYAIEPQRRMVVVLGPLVALQDDQCKRCEIDADLRAVQLSRLTPARRNELLRQIVKQERAVDVLLLTPEMVFEGFGNVRKALKQLHDNDRIGSIVLDEAHYVRQTDSEFRHKYRGIGDWLKSEMQRAPLIAMSGTMNNDVVAELLSLGSDGQTIGRLSPTESARTCH